MLHPRLLLILSLLTAWPAALAGCGENKGSEETLPSLPPSSSVTLQTVTTSLASPVFMTAAPGDGTRLFILEQEGTIKIFDVVTGSLQPTSFLSLAGLITSSGEQGLLGMAFDPAYGANGRFYVFYTNTNGAVVIARYQRYLFNPN